MQVYLVGGAVRDKLLNRIVTERDWVVVGATAKQLTQRGYTQVGKDFPVFLHPKTQEEYALARTERKTGSGYTGFSCHAAPNVTLEEDLLRRDLTINAMAESADGQLIDPYNGLTDLKNRVLRHVSPAFREDPLRIFRVARFAARYAYLGFSVAPETMTLMRDMCASDDILHLSAERVWQETRRALMESSPQVYFTILHASGALNAWMPELAGLAELPATSDYLYRAAAADAALNVRWAALCWPLSAPAVTSLQQRLKVPNQESDAASLASSFTAQIPEHYLDPAWLLALFNTVDVWRRPERLTPVISLLGIIYPEYANRYQTVVELALNAAKTVDVKAIIAAGYSGSQIKQQVTEQRLLQISTVTTNRGV